PLSSLLLKTNVDKLTILPGGKPPQNPAELMSSNHMSKLLKEITSKYSDRYIIIDSPPPHLTSETRVIARQVDGILLVVKSGSTDRKMVEELLEMIGKEKVLGVVLNCFDLSSTRYYGYNKYSKYKNS
ncbi:MAG: exopolysaccharide biosynthesis protein, partial [Deltaproteobacteria bacterium]|nr:exopolysaccharide biosynthesis protein [Deltaproteobacteria bacterium]